MTTSSIHEHPYMTTARRVYVSGPMTGLPNFNFDAFKLASQVLRDHGYVVACPTEINPDHSTPRAVCLKADIAELVKCDAVALLPGWERSHGARLEVEVALGCGLLLATVDDLVQIATRWWSPSSNTERLFNDHLVHNGGTSTGAR